MALQRRAGRPSLDKCAILLAHPLFAPLGRPAIERLSAYAVARSVKRGTTIFSKGDPGASMCAVCTGVVKITVPSEGGKDAVFNLVGPGQIFGEIALLDGGQRTADAIATTNCELLVIERRDFVPLLLQQPEMALKLIEILCSRLRNTSEQVEDVLFLDLPGRLAKALLRLTGSTEPSAPRQKVVITQREIGRLIGASRESTNRQLRLWQQRKWIKLARGAIIVLDPAALSALVATESSPLPT